MATPNPATQIRYVQDPNVLTRDLRDAVLILQPANDDVIILRGTAREVWREFDRPSTIDLAIARLAEQFGASEDGIRRDVSALTLDLAQRTALVEQ